MTTTSNTKTNPFPPAYIGLAFVPLIPLLSIPGPAMATGHPWKVELAMSLIVTAAFIWYTAKGDPDSVRSLLAPRPIVFALVSIGLFTLWSGVSIFWAPASVSVVHHTSVWFLYASIFLIALLHFQKTRSIQSALIALALLSLVIMVICVFDYLSTAELGLVQSKQRIRYSKYGELLAMIAPLLFSAVYYAKNAWGKAVWMMAGTSAWFVVMLSLSKGAFVAGCTGIALGFIATFVYGGRKIRKSLLVTAMTWVVLTMAVQMASFSSVAPSTINRITTNSGNSNISLPFRIFTWKIGLSMALSHPVAGVGADNFGTSFNEARRLYFSDNPPSGGGTSIAEGYMFERAHNEPLQILAELGTVGLLLFGLIILAFVLPLFARIRRRKRLSPVLIGSAAAMTAFAVSSMVSSFSFRAIQNGAVFMIILAIGLYELTKHEKRMDNPSDTVFGPSKSSSRKWLLPATPLLFIVFYAVIGLSNLYTHFGLEEKDRSRSAGYFETALRLNPENGAAYYLYGVRKFLEKRPSEALPLLEKSRHYGTGATLNYYYTASSHLLNNDRVKAAGTLSEAVEIFPRSVYARVHYAVLLEMAGKSKEAEKQYSAAYALDNRQAETWKLVLEDSLLNATDATRNRTDLDKPNELVPKNIIRSIFHISRLEKTNG